MGGLRGGALPEGKVLIPGVIDTCTNYIEHPEAVAQRIVRYARVVGRETRHRRHRLRFQHDGRTVGR